MPIPNSTRRTLWVVLLFAVLVAPMARAQMTLFDTGPGETWVGYCRCDLRLNHYDPGPDPKPDWFTTVKSLLFRGSPRPGQYVFDKPDGPFPTQKACMTAMEPKCQKFCTSDVFQEFQPTDALGKGRFMWDLGFGYNYFKVRRYDPICLPDDEGPPKLWPKEIRHPVPDAELEAARRHARNKKLRFAPSTCVALPDATGHGSISGSIGVTPQHVGLGVAAVYLGKLIVEKGDEILSVVAEKGNVFFRLVGNEASAILNLVPTGWIELQMKLMQMQDKVIGSQIEAENRIQCGPGDEPNSLKCKLPTGEILEFHGVGSAKPFVCSGG